MNHYPQLPPLYFHDSHQNHSPNKKYYDSIVSSTSARPLLRATILTGLCSELETKILSYLTWGDYEHISRIHSSFASLVHDAACISQNAKWSYAHALLHGTEGLEPNISLAVQYLTDLAHGIPEKEKKDEDRLNPIQIDAMMELAFLHLEQKIIIPVNKKIEDPVADFTHHGLEQHHIKGLQWLQTAFDEHQHLQAAYELAIIYEYGKYDVPVNVMKAAEWFAFAAESGHVNSMYEYALCYELGCGVVQNDLLALDWYTKAANAGCMVSNFSVGEWFESARGGLPQSDTEAVLWYYKAAKMGDEDSIKALKRLKDIARIVVPGWAATLHE